MNSQSIKRNKTYFISDLHLDPSRSHLFDLFHKFINKITSDAEALYILGDLFEFWIGDDIIDLPEGKPYLPVIEQLKNLSDSGVKLFFIQGNRDFLIGERFMQRIGGTMLPDHCVIDLYGTKALIMHGDTLCTDDKAYQRMRTIFRWRLVQKLYLAMSPAKRNKKASQIRQKTKKSTQKKSSMILDVNQAAVEQCLSPELIKATATYPVDLYESEHDLCKRAKRWGVQILIHGHTHRPAEHGFNVGGHELNRIVLGDWGDKWSYLEWSQSLEFRLYC